MRVLLERLRAWLEWLRRDLPVDIDPAVLRPLEARVAETRRILAERRAVTR